MLFIFLIEVSASFWEYNIIITSNNILKTDSEPFFWDAWILTYVKSHGHKLLKTTLNVMKSRLLYKYNRENPPCSAEQAYRSQFIDSLQIIWPAALFEHQMGLPKPHESIYWHKAPPLGMWDSLQSRLKAWFEGQLAEMTLRSASSLTTVK